MAISSWGCEDHKDKEIRKQADGFVNQRPKGSQVVEQKTFWRDSRTGEYRNEPASGKDQPRVAVRFAK